MNSQAMVNPFSSRISPVVLNPLQSPRAPLPGQERPGPVVPADQFVSSPTSGHLQEAFEAPVLLPENPPSPLPKPESKVAEKVFCSGGEVKQTAWGALMIEDPSPVQDAPRQPYRAPVEKALVVGGGPGGLAAAIKMAEQGIRVTVVEVRDSDYQRPHHLNARLSTLQEFQEFGIYDQVREASGWSDEVDQAIQGKVALVPRTIVQSESVAQVRISDVEKALYQRAQQLGIEYIPHHRAHLGEPDENGLYSVELEKVSLESGVPVGTGQRQAYGKPDLVVVCDGAGSPTRKSLGIDFLEESEPRVYLGGQVNQALDVEDKGYKKLASLEGDQLRHYMATGHQKYPQTWVSVEADAGVRQLSPEERTEYLAQRASAVMGKRITAEDISWGAGQITVVQNRRAERTVAGSNVVLLGDSVRTGSVWQSGGLNLALTADIRNLTRTLESINQSGFTREAALKNYDNRSRVATTAWHQAGQRELSGQMPEGNVPVRPFLAS